MILGIGTDVVALAAMADQIGEPGSRFVSRAFTVREVRAARARVTARGGDPSDPTELAPHLGARWAAKEAAVKAWSAALSGRAPPLAESALDWREVEVREDHWGRPRLALGGRVALEVSRTLGPRSPAIDEGDSGGLVWHLSMSHDAGIAQAFVVLERIG